MFLLTIFKLFLDIHFVSNFQKLGANCLQIGCYIMKHSLLFMQAGDFKGSLLLLYVLIIITKPSPNPTSSRLSTRV
jgi:hypothetical protein